MENMCKSMILSSVFAFMAIGAFAQVAWHNPQPGRNVHNQGWNEDGGNYWRLPLRAKGLVRDAVWNLACNSAGLVIRFNTDAQDIRVKYTVTGPLSMPHMPATGVSGVDLYRDSDGAFCFGSYSFGDTIRYVYHIDRNNREGTEDYTLYLPLYNGVESLEIGVPEGRDFAFTPAEEVKPIVLYGTSIAQGACASRPGMAWGNIVSRDLRLPLINLGFSGNGKLEKKVLDLIIEQDACAYVVDCMANLTDRSGEDVTNLVVNAVRQIRSRRTAPILLVEHAGYSNGGSNQGQHDAYMNVNKAQARAFALLTEAGVERLYYLSREEIAMHPDSWVDYVHPSDYGMVQQARAVENVLKDIIR